LNSDLASVLEVLDDASLDTLRLASVLEVLDSASLDAPQSGVSDAASFEIRLLARASSSTDSASLETLQTDTVSSSLATDAFLSLAASVGTPRTVENSSMSHTLVYPF